MRRRRHCKINPESAFCYDRVDLFDIAYYVSAHGFGHGSRTSDILRVVEQLYPGTSISLVSNLPTAFLARRFESKHVQFRSQYFDVGMVQIDAIRVDVDSTLQQLQIIYSQRETLLERECAFLRKNRVRLVVSDIPALPIEAAALCGIPSIAVSNFGWDWIYAPFVSRNEEWKRVIEKIEAGYAKADLLLRLPFCEEMRAFPRAIDISLVASAGRDRRSEIAGRTGCPEDRSWVLLGFSSLPWNESNLDAVEQAEGFEFFAAPPSRWRRRNIHPTSDDISFSDLLASVDCVISKPGFGIVSECVVNEKPLLYVEREDFREYPILEAAIRRHLTCRHLPADELYRGQLTEGLKELLAQPPTPRTLPLDGAAVAATKMLEFVRAG